MPARSEGMRKVCRRRFAFESARCGLPVPPGMPGSPMTLRHLKFALTQEQLESKRSSLAAAHGRADLAERHAGS